MNSKTVGIVFILLLAIVALMFFLMPGITETPITAENPDDTAHTSGFRAEENMVVVMEQKPSTEVKASQVVLATPGFLVIQADANGERGEVLGASSLLQAGETSDFTVALSRASKNGEKLHATLYNDTDGSGSYTSADQPVQSVMGGALSGWFDIANDAGEPAPISI
jgi:hypothetical protein